MKYKNYYSNNSEYKTKVLGSIKGDHERVHEKEINGRNL